MARQTLGRGLSAFWATKLRKDDRTLELDIDQIEPNSEQPRTRFADAALDELAQSIKANGIVQPIVVRRKGAAYQIVAGERRWRAAQRAGLRRMPAVVRDVSDDKLLELALVENIQRQELNPVEEARAYRKLIETIGLTQEMVSERVGKERSLISTSLSVFKVAGRDPGIDRREKLTAGHGRALLMADDAAAQRRAAKAIIEGSLSVREAEKLIKRAAAGRSQPIDNKEVKPVKDANITSCRDKAQTKTRNQREYTARTGNEWQG